jgi:hypothetical protein
MTDHDEPAKKQTTEKSAAQTAGVSSGSMTPLPIFYRCMTVVRAAAMSKRLVLACAACLFLSTNAFAQNVNDLFRLFGGMMQQAVIQTASSEWRKLPASDFGCIDQALRQQGTSVEALVHAGVMPSDSRLSALRSDCRRAVAQGQEPIGGRVSPYIVDGLRLYAQVQFQSRSYQEYQCSPSERFPGFTWCHKEKTEETKRGELTSSNSILHSQDGTALYINRYIEPAFFQSSDVRAELARLSASFGQHSRELQMPPRAGLPNAIIAVWGEIKLNQLDPNDVSIVASGDTPHKGLLVSFLGDLQRSARAGLPIYSLSGGPGFLWVANFNAEGRGNLRFLTIDASQIGASPPIIAQAPNQPPPVSEPRPSPPVDTTSPPAPPPPIPKLPPVETPILRQGKVLLDDIRAFITTQNSIEQINDIAREAANLHTALDKFDETATIQSKKKLLELLTPIKGFTEFVQQKESERQRDRARRLAVISAEAEKWIYFVDEYLRKNLGDERTGQLLKLKDRLSAALKSQSIEDVGRENDALQAYLTETGLRGDYDRIVRDYSQPTAPSPNARPKSPEDELGLTEKSRFLVQGPEDDLIILYNSSPSAPSVAKDIVGRFVFLTEDASFCPAQPRFDEDHLWLVERLLRDEGALDIKHDQQPCNFSNATVSSDFIIFSRGELAKQRKEYIVALANLVETDAFRQFRVVSAADYASEIQNRRALALTIAKEVDGNQRAGYGLLIVTDAPLPVCLVTPFSNVDYLDGLKELLQGERLAISHKLLPQWQFVDMKVEDAFIALMKQQCGYVAGEAGALRNVMQALRREKKLYEFAPIWFEADKVAAISAEIRQKKAEAAAAIKRQEDLNNAQNQKLQAQKEAVEANLREDSGPKAQALRDRIHNLINELPKDTADASRNLKTQQRLFEAERLFPEYLNWLNKQLAAQWETMDVQSEVNDFGVVQWNGRPLDGVIVKTTVKLRNRPQGAYETGCFLLGLVDDVEFAMQRDPFAVACDSSASQQTITKWKQRRQFKSKWNWETDTKTANRTSIWPWSR